MPFPLTNAISSIPSLFKHDGLTEEPKLLWISKYRIKKRINTLEVYIPYLFTVEDTLLDIRRVFMDTIARGGRGHKAPYDTTHQRIPVEVKPVIDKITKAYRVAYFERSEDGADDILSDITEAVDNVINKDVNKFVDILDKQQLLAMRDRIIRKTRSDKLKAVTKALDEFIEELEKEEFADV